MAVSTSSFIRAAKQISSRASGRLISPVAVRYALGQGFNVESFNPRGNIQPWSIIGLADFASNFMYLPMVNNRPFLDFDRLVSYLSFVVAADVCIGKEMYDPSVDKSRLEIEYTLSHIGTSSITMRYDFFFPPVDKSITTGQFKFILVDEETRRPSSVPQWWREKYSVHLPQNVSPFTVSSASRNPYEQFDSSTFKVLPSLIDSNLHHGWYSQVKMYMDAYISWHHKNFGFDGKGHAFRNVKYLKLLFQNEASLGDTLKIDLHSVPGNENSFTFFMDNSTMENKPVSQCCMEFYPAKPQQQYMNKL